MDSRIPLVKTGLVEVEELQCNNSVIDKLYVRLLISTENVFLMLLSDSKLVKTH